MPKHFSIPVRLDPDQAEAVKRFARRYRVPEQQIIRWACEALIAYVELHGGDLHLPLDFNRYWKIVQERAPLRVADQPTADAPAPHQGNVKYAKKAN